MAPVTSAVPFVEAVFVRESGVPVKVVSTLEIVVRLEVERECTRRLRGLSRSFMRRDMLAGGPPLLIDDMTGRGGWREGGGPEGVVGNADDKERECGREYDLRRECRGAGVAPLGDDDEVESWGWDLDWSV